ncbi:MAG: DUF5683 domain-containing protein [Deltaproteobacteria bacterium]|nr:DUF5683 domain-containing protein [Deltaproteobacteria bacterium]
MLVAALALVLAAADADPPAAGDPPAAQTPADKPAAAPSADSDVTTLPVFVDEGVLLDALNTLLLTAKEAGRVAVIVDDADPLRRLSLERSLVRTMRDRRREEVVTPALVKASLDHAAQVQLLGGNPKAATSLAADHIITATVIDQGGKPTLQLKLLYTETGGVLGTQSVDVDGKAQATSARSLDVRTAAADLADVIAEGVENRGVDVKSHRIAVPPAQATGAAKEARLDRFVQSELTAALRARGFLVVERGQLSTAMEQLSIQELTGTERVAELGQLLGAQSLALAQISEAGTTFIISARVVAVDSSEVLGAGSATIVRDDVVSLAAVETRTPGEAAVRSAIAPGWGQAFNGDGVKAVLFGLSTYGALATTVGLGIGAGASWAGYNGVSTESQTPEEAGKQAVDLRNQTNNLLTATAVAGAVTASVWSLNVVDALLSSPPE